MVERHRVGHCDGNPNALHGLSERKGNTLLLYVSTEGEAEKLGYMKRKIVYVTLMTGNHMKLSYGQGTMSPLILHGIGLAYGINCFSIVFHGVFLTFVSCQHALHSIRLKDKISAI